MLHREAGSPPTNAEPLGVVSPSKSAAPPLLRYVVLDIETQRGPDELPTGWAGMREGEGGFSAGCLYDSETNWVYYYGPTDAHAFADAIEQAQVIVSFNGDGFDIPAISGMLKRNLKIDTHLDLLSVLTSAAGSRKGLSLANVGQFTLGRTKTGAASQAPDLYKAATRGGDGGLESYTRLLNYNGNDVRLTRDLLLFAQEHGFLVGPHGPIHLTLPDWVRRLK